MRICCPNCGERDRREFSYLGDASLVRPSMGAAVPQETFHEYIHLRDNPAGPHKEFWYHAAGCRSWLIVSRNTTTHEIAEVIRVSDAAPPIEVSRT